MGTRPFARFTKLSDDRDESQNDESNQFIYIHGLLVEEIKEMVVPSREFIRINRLFIKLLQERVDTLIDLTSKSKETTELFRILFSYL